MTCISNKGIGSRAAILLTVITALITPACIHLQEQVENQQRDILRQQNSIDVLERSLAQFKADAGNELDKIKRDIQLLKGDVEELSHHSDKDIAELKQNIQQLAATIEESLKERVQAPGVQTPPPGDHPEGTREPPGPAGTSGAQEQYNRAQTLYRQGDFEKARELYTAFLMSYADSTLADNALYWIGNCYYREKNYQKAIQTFDDVINKFPGGNKVPDAYFVQALSFLAIDDELSAQIVLETLIQKHPGSSAAMQAQQKLAGMSGKKGP